MKFPMVNMRWRISGRTSLFRISSQEKSQISQDDPVSPFPVNKSDQQSIWYYGEGPKYQVDQQCEQLTKFLDQPFLIEKRGQIVDSIFQGRI